VNVAIISFLLLFTPASLYCLWKAHRLETTMEERKGATDQDQFQQDEIRPTEEPADLFGSCFPRSPPGAVFLTGWRDPDLICGPRFTRPP
jgi:hypothetical protein